MIFLYYSLNCACQLTRPLTFVPTGWYLETHVSCYLSVACMYVVRGGLLNLCDAWYRHTTLLTRCMTIYDTERYLTVIGEDEYFWWQCLMEGSSASPGYEVVLLFNNLYEDDHDCGELIVNQNFFYRSLFYYNVHLKSAFCVLKLENYYISFMSFEFCVSWKGTIF